MNVYVYHISDQRTLKAETLLQAVWDTEDNGGDNNIETKTENEERK